VPEHRLRNPSGLLSPGVPTIAAGVPLGPDLVERNPRHRFPLEICCEAMDPVCPIDFARVSAAYPRGSVYRPKTARVGRRSIGSPVQTLRAVRTRNRTDPRIIIACEPRLDELRVVTEFRPQPTTDDRHAHRRRTVRRAASTAD